MNGIKLAAALPYLLLKEKYFKIKANKSNLPGIKFYFFGKKIAKILLSRGIFSPKLFLNPISIVRYFEYDFIESNLKIKDGDKILDVSSPYLFGFFIAMREKVEYNYINPDRGDLDQLSTKANKLKFLGKYKTSQIDVLDLPYQSEYFDNIISISVIEHIDKDKDSHAVSEMWKALKPGGRLILTFPVSKSYYEEFRSEDVYKLGYSQKNEDYFFQRIYDEKAIKNRILSTLNNYEISEKKIFGEKNSTFYVDYKERWMNKDYFETVKDPYYISKYFKEFESTDQLPGIGVMGLSIRKMK